MEKESVEEREIHKRIKEKGRMERERVEIK